MRAVYSICLQGCLVCLLQTSLEDCHLTCCDTCAERDSRYTVRKLACRHTSAWAPLQWQTVRLVASSCKWH